MIKFCRLIFLGAILASCYPKGPEYVSDLDLVVTNYDDEFNFGDLNTFFIFDTIVRVGDNYSQSLPYSYDDEVLDRIRQNMLSRGWVEVNTNSQADLVMHTTAWNVTNVTYFYDWYYYWGWGYPGYGGWGWYYPPGYTYVTSYTFGTVLMEMAYPAGSNFENETIPVVWTGLVNGLLEGSNAEIEYRIQNGIDQCFTQSPYLQPN